MGDASLQELLPILVEKALFIERNRLNLSVQENLLETFLICSLHQNPQYLLPNTSSSP